MGSTGQDAHSPLVREPAPFEMQNPLPDEKTMKNEKWNEST
jgi:hypothetical protein